MGGHQCGARSIIAKLIVSFLNDLGPELVKRLSHNIQYISDVLDTADLMDISEELEEDCMPAEDSQPEMGAPSSSNAPPPPPHLPMSNEQPGT